MTSRRRIAAVLVPAMVACYPTTTRPAFVAKPSAPSAELELGIPEATRAVALMLDADSIPVRRTEPKDGWLESEWFDARTLKPTTARPLGPDVVKVRAWVYPSRPNFSDVIVETVYRPLADPSRAPRELEQQVPTAHPVATRVQAALAGLTKQYGPKIDTTAAALADSLAKHLPPGGKKKLRALADSLGHALLPDSIARRLPADSTAKPARPDSTPKRPAPDSTGKPVKPDSTGKPTLPDSGKTVVTDTIALRHRPVPAPRR